MGHCPPAGIRWVTLSPSTAVPLGLRQREHDINNMIANAQAKVWQPSHKADMNLPNTCYFANPDDKVTIN
jgi:hypothetical protein